MATVDQQLDGLLCLSHLRWGFVWQRPQHLLTRFAKQMPVIFVEEPEFEADRSADDLRITMTDGVTQITPLLAGEAGGRWGFNAHTNPRIRRLLSPYLARRGWTNPRRSICAWYYAPKAFGAMPDAIDPALMVYDVMDELANFAGAPADMREAERRMERLADVVFTGGPSLYAARVGKHPYVYCFPSGVERCHFAKAIDHENPAPEVAGLPQPVIGFYGVIDERVDLELLGAIADRRPDWSFVMIGPVVKINPASLPRRDNIHYLGKKTYDQLPSYLSGFDVAMLPFAINEATTFISPTKTLEYMAAQKRIVSTPINDVLTLYGEVVKIASDSECFVAAIEALLNEAPAVREARLARADQILAEHEWDVIAFEMRTQMAAALARRADRLVGAEPALVGAVAGVARTQSVYADLNV